VSAPSHVQPSPLTGEDPAPHRRRDTAQPAWRARLWPVPYILPALALVAFVFGVPLLQVVNLAFRAGGQAGAALSLENFTLLFGDPTLKTAATNNLKLLLAVPIATVVALVLAILVYEQVRGWRVYRSLLFVPYVLAIPVVGLIFSIIYSQHGPLNEVMRVVGLGGLTHEWLGDPSWALAAILAVIVWKEIGFGLLLFSAGLSNADQELYDAANVDGATWWQRQRHVTIPQLGPVIEFYIVVEAITMLSWVFGYVFTMTKGGPGFSTYVMEYLVWSQGFVSQNRGLASAVAVMLLVGAITVIVVLRLALRRLAS
jgi:ABC-type sugar transport system permease subunit